jgi:hypothetical protein
MPAYILFLLRIDPTIALAVLFAILATNSAKHLLSHDFICPYHFKNFWLLIFYCDHKVTFYLQNAA